MTAFKGQDRITIDAVIVQELGGNDRVAVDVMRIKECKRTSGTSASTSQAVNLHEAFDPTAEGLALKSPRTKLTNRKEKEKDDGDHGCSCGKERCDCDGRILHSSWHAKHFVYRGDPHFMFGPKAFLGGSEPTSFFPIHDTSAQLLHWISRPNSVLIVRKHHDDSVLIPFKEIVTWLTEDMDMEVYVEKSVIQEAVILKDEVFKQILVNLKTFTEGVDDISNKIDLILCLGGDGTLLYVNSLFQSSVPPVISFNMGSLGFLTPFRFDESYRHHIRRALTEKSALLLRFRLKCVVVRHDAETQVKIPAVKFIRKEHTSLKSYKIVLNEVVIDRGLSSYLSNLDLYIDKRKVTTVQGDGLIISTATGSTAYAVAAGASMVHPSVPSILITPICPHSLSFRPIVVPAGVEIRVVLSPNARGTAMVSFDGRDRQEIHQSDSLRITTFHYPVPSVCAGDQIEDWFDGLYNCLNWNLRQIQKPLSTSSSCTSIDSMSSQA